MKTIFINGLSGKMGKAINNLILDDPDFEIVKTVSDSDVVIDFSRPESTMPLVQEAKEYKKPLVIGTTGFTDIELKLIEEASNEIPIMLSFNMSKGIFYFKKNIKSTIVVLFFVFEKNNIIFLSSNLILNQTQIESFVDWI